MNWQIFGPKQIIQLGIWYILIYILVPFGAPVNLKIRLVVGMYKAKAIIAYFRILEYIFFIKNSQFER